MRNLLPATQHLSSSYERIEDRAGAVQRRAGIVRADRAQFDPGRSGEGPALLCVGHDLQLI